MELLDAFTGLKYDPIGRYLIIDGVCVSTEFIHQIVELGKESAAVQFDFDNEMETVLVKRII